MPNLTRTQGLVMVLVGITLHASATAGPPFLTDDPEPTPVHHWEIYAPLVEWRGRSQDFEGAFGSEFNYGAASNVQVTLGLPVAFSHDSGGWRSGADDIRLSIKYRFYQNEEGGVQVAFFPGVTIPTGGNGFGAGRTTALLPVWVQREAGPWLVFGGGGYDINPGPGRRNYWIGAMNVSRNIGERLLIGVEAQRQTADVDGGTASTSLGIGAIYHPGKPFRLLARVGPTFDDAGGPTSFHAFLALGLEF